MLSVGNGKNGSGLYCINPLTGKVFANERVLYKHVEKHGYINDEWDSEGFAVGKWHTAAGAKVLGVVDGRKTSTVPDAPARVPFIPRVTAEISAAESAKEALATAYEEHIAAVAKDPVWQRRLSSCCCVHKTQHCMQRTYGRRRTTASCVQSRQAHTKRPLP